MDDKTAASLSSRLEFLRAAERMKDTLRSAYTTGGRTESVAEHTWCLTLIAAQIRQLLDTETKANAEKQAAAD